MSENMSEWMFLIVCSLLMFFGCNSLIDQKRDCKDNGHGTNLYNGHKFNGSLSAPRYEYHEDGSPVMEQRCRACDD
jgi:hypothetical protein